MTKNKFQTTQENIAQGEIVIDSTLAEYCFQMIQIKVHLKLLKTSNLYGSPAWVSCKSQYYALVEKATSKIPGLPTTEKPLEVIEKLNAKFLSDAGIWLDGTTINDRPFEMGNIRD
jgi:hypothetical protein